MTGWIFALALAIVAGLALWRFGRLTSDARGLAAAALLLGVAGYAWQGSPGLPGRATRPSDPGMQPDSAFARQRGAMMVQRFGTTAQWLAYADALHRMGSDRLAVTAVKSGLRERPRDPDLWVGLGNALVLHADGFVTPAARLAFDRAAALSPEHPGPPYFLGLAFAQAGQFEQASAIWGALLRRGPPDAPWREEVAMRLAMLEMGR